MAVPGGLGERQDAESVLFRDHMSGQVSKQLHLCMLGITRTKTWSSAMRSSDSRMRKETIYHLSQKALSCKKLQIGFDLAASLRLSERNKCLL
jgi:hypothetical protein